MKRHVLTPPDMPHGAFTTTLLDAQEAACIDVSAWT